MAERPHIAPLLITVEPGDYVPDPYEVRLGGELIGYRPWTGASGEEIAAEVSGALASLLAERLGWPQTKPEGAW